MLLTHSALGLDANVESWAEWLRGEGHEVITPDLYGGDTYDNFDAGAHRAESLEMKKAAQAIQSMASELDRPVVLMGFSLGAALCEMTALTEPDIAGLILVGTAASPEWFGNPPWPKNLKAQVHFAAEDRWIEPAEVAALAATAPPGALEVFEYPGSAHLFAFPNYVEYEPLAADRLRSAVRRFLAMIGEQA
ncbi:alpha/beta fold hydrolase [Demequina sp.]|uniref:dienelactone hydrolase family protein n=1 Tax=Demequina sp. TaxID=2050685 RepID=UPI0025B7DB25|nr:alpha/beta fold hydrolase [Demequina sp.]